MARLNFRWKFALFFYLIILNVFVENLPIIKTLPNISTSNSSYSNLDIPVIQEVKHAEPRTIEASERITIVDDERNSTSYSSLNMTRNSLIRNVRPDQDVTQYFVELTINGDSFEGSVVMSVRLSFATREDPIVLHMENLDINEVSSGVGNNANLEPTDFWADDGILEIFPPRLATSYTVRIDYSGNLGRGGTGLYLGDYIQNNYIAMNLHPTHARRVFPCMDEATAISNIAFSIDGVNYNHLVGNSALEDGSAGQFRVMQGPPHRWGLIAHSFDPINQPTANVQLFGRAGVFQQEALTSAAINHYFNNLNEWTNKDFFHIDELNQDGRMVILALPDVTETWHSLSVVGIWEPYLFMQTSHAVKQRSTALVKIGEAIARQWFGYVIFPVNWRFEWINTGLASYVTWELLRSFQDSNLSNDITLLDVNTLFVTEVIQESLLRDAYVTSRIMEPDDDLFDEDVIRTHLNGLIKYKAPVIMKMLSTLLTDGETDFIQIASQVMLNDDTLNPIDTNSFVDGVNSQFNGNDFIGDFEEDLEQWLKNTGYPIVHVNLRQGGAFLTQERFSFSPVNQASYGVPITFTTSVNPNFDNLVPQMIMDNTEILDFTLGEEDWVLLNIQGQGYYRVNYDSDMWERIIEALSEPDRREEIHPLNRATLVDDTLNLARANKLSYETAFEVVLTMEHELEYAPWKAFVRNMDFLRKRLTAMVETDEDLDPDIYLRMVRRTVGLVENEIGFYPDLQLSEPAMTSLTRGLVMDHACRAKYDPCIAAAVDWFYDENANEPTVNPDIPLDIRPAVYCTMVREGDGDVIEALRNRLEIEPTQYERVVIMEAMGCSSDSDFISSLLEETISPDAPYMVEERLRIFKSIVESSYSNVFAAIDFARRRTSEMREMYGGPHKLEEAIFHLAENVADRDHAQEFQTWVFNVNNNLDDSQDNIFIANDYIEETLAWDEMHLEFVYDWINENSAPTLATSVLLICITALITLFNH